MDCEEPSSSSRQMKREHDDDDEIPDTSYKMVQYLEILQIEASSTDELDEQIVLEAGDWCPAA